MSRIIICYRPADSQAITNRIYDQLCNTYGDDAVVLGAKSLLRAGDDYIVTIPTQIQEAQALVVVIGSDWTAGEWLSDETAMDRIAIAVALQSQVRVVPVLVNGAIMPSAVNLPDDLQSLTRRVALSMSDTTFRQDVPALVDSVMPSDVPPQQLPPEPVEPVSSQPPPPNPILAKAPPTSSRQQPAQPFPQPSGVQASPTTQTFSLDPENVRLIVAGFAAITGILIIIATGAFSWVGIENVGSSTPLDIIEESPRTIDYILLLIPIGGVALITVAGAIFTRRLKTEYGLLSIAGIAAVLFCVPFLWRFLNNRDYKSELENAGYSPEVIDQFLDNVSALYSLAEFIWIPVAILVMAMGGWWFLRSRPQLQLTLQSNVRPKSEPTAQPKASHTPSDAAQSASVPWQRTPLASSLQQARAVKSQSRPFYRRPVVGIFVVLVIVAGIVGVAAVSQFTNSNGKSSSESLPELDGYFIDQSGTRYSHNSDWTPVMQTFNGVEMMLVPAGCFMMGHHTGDPDDRPVHEQCFDNPFWIDRYEVTNGQFENFDGQAEIDNRQTTGNLYPRNAITWFEARDFCILRGVRLPTEAEWEYAARGPEGWYYPWGNELVVNNVVSRENSGEQNAPVGSKPAGVSWVGAFDLSGNVKEWTSSIFEDYPYDPNDGRETSSDTHGSRGSRVMRGGSANTYAYNTQTNYRGGTSPDYASYNIGLRCARSYD